MLKIKCYRCDEELEEMGGLLISPPELGKIGMHHFVEKIHLCTKCYGFVVQFLQREH